MKRHTRLHLVVLAFLAVALCGGVAAAQPQPSPNPDPVSPVEVWGALHATFGSDAGQLPSSYVPQVGSAPDAEGRARQVLALDPAKGRGGEFGVNLFPSRAVGIQAFVSYASADVGGVNAPYEIDLRYTSRPPPDNRPIPVEVHRSLAWPDTTGRLRQWTLGVGPAVRWRRSPASVVVSGGIAWARTSGEAEPLGFTTFWLGGHSVLFSEDVRLRVSLDPTMSVGGYLGTALGLDLARHLALTASVRLLLVGELDVPARIDAILDGTGGLTSPEPGDIDRIVAAGPARLTPQRLSVAVGLTVR